MSRRVPKHVWQRLRREGKISTRPERVFQAEQSLRDVAAHEGMVAPALMRMSYKRGVAVSTIAEISGRTESEVKEAIVMADSEAPQNAQDAPVTPVDPPFGETAADRENAPENAPESADAPQEGADVPEPEDLGDGGLDALSDGELTAKASELRQAGNADAAAAYDHELESRSND